MHIVKWTCILSSKPTFCQVCLCQHLLKYLIKFSDSIYFGLIWSFKEIYVISTQENWQVIKKQKKTSPKLSTQENEMQRRSQEPLEVLTFSHTYSKDSNSSLAAD